MKITSSYHKTLHCQVGNKSIGIEPNQVLIVEDDFGEALIKNLWIRKVSDLNAEARVPCTLCAAKAPIPYIEKSIERKEEPIEKKEIKKPIEEKIEKVIEKKEEIVEIEIPKKKNPIKKIKVDKNYLKD